LEGIAAALGVADVVEFLGQVPDEAMGETYSRAHVFVLPAREEARGSDVEGFGIVCLEASASGLPVVAGMSGGVPEAVQDGQTGILVSPGDAEGLARTILRLLSDSGLREQMGVAGRQWVEAEMNWDRATQEFLSALERLA
jgi:phosphatidylinositol alpha-1,6-mannosyltransferase